MKPFNLAIAAAIVLAGAAGAYYLVNKPRSAPATKEDGHFAAPAEVMERGPHRGRMLRGEGLDLEITIFETNVPPEFRVYAYEKEKSIAPSQVQLTILLHRLRRKDTITFAPELDYLKSDQEVVEPHSFDVEVNAKRDGKPFTWAYKSYEGRVEISDDAAREGGIEIAVAGPATLHGELALPGEIGLDTNRIVHVVPRLGGVVRKVFKNLGDEVVAEDLLAVIDSRELADMKSQYLASIERRELAQARYDREKRLFDRKISSEEDYLSAKQALAEVNVDLRTAEQKLRSLSLTGDQVATLRSQKDKSLTEYEIRSPIDGTVIEKHLGLGEAVGDDAEAFVVADLSSVWVEIVVYAADLKRIQEGQKVSVHSEDLDATAEGSIAYIGALVGPQTRTAKAIVELPNPKGLWRPGLFVTVTLSSEEFIAPVAVPEDAIQTFRDWSVVFLKAGNLYEIIPVELGRHDAGLVEITQGLQPGDEYVSKNSYLIKADIEKSGASHDH